MATAPNLRAIPSGLAARLVEAQARVDQELTRLLADRADDGRDAGSLREGMRYAVLGEGKRIRPVVAFAAAEAVGSTWDAALPAAAAIELLHAYTLVHDDLPAMDDDAERRGRPTVHVAFGEWTAILVGDALLTAAFEALAPLGPRAADAIRILAGRAGARELLAGQARDLEVVRGPKDLPPIPLANMADLERLHAQKTGALFAAAAELGALAGGADLAERSALSTFGLELGLMFQHADDLSDGDRPDTMAESRRRLKVLSARLADAAAARGERGTLLGLLVKWVSGT